MDILAQSGQRGQRRTVDALVKAVTSRYDIVARYYKIKRQLLGLDELYDYDRYAPLETRETRYQWSQAREIVLNAYNAFHPQMAEIADSSSTKNGFTLSSAGKRGGAFAAPTIPSLHPYVFLNYTGSDKDVMTLAHELGHGIHMYLSRPKGALEAGTPLTTAEMASVFGRCSFFNDLMQRETDPAVRLSMLARKLEDSFATIFRQISMNRFEDAIHTARRSEGELSRERYSELWLKTQRDMFQDSVTMRDDYGIWWSYVRTSSMCRVTSTLTPLAISWYWPCSTSIKRRGHPSRPNTLMCCLPAALIGPKISCAKRV